MKKNFLSIIGAEEIDMETTAAESASTSSPTTTKRIKVRYESLSVQFRYSNNFAVSALILQKILHVARSKAKQRYAMTFLKVENGLLKNAESHKKFLVSNSYA